VLPDDDDVDYYDLLNQICIVTYDGDLFLAHREGSKFLLLVAICIWMILRLSFSLVVLDFPVREEGQFYSLTD
jgi:hypothetical protein